MVELNKKSFKNIKIKYGENERRTFLRFCTKKLKNCIH